MIKLLNSLRKLCTEESKNYMRDVSLNVSKMVNLNQSSNNANEENNQPEKEIKEEEKENNEDNENNEKKEAEKKESNEGNEDLKQGTIDEKQTSKQDGGEKEKLQTNEEPNNIKKENENNNKEIDIIDNGDNNKNDNNINSNDENTLNNNKPANINNSTTVNINMSGIGSMSLLEQDEEAKLIKSYKEYLAQAEKTIDALFLMKTKNDFLQMVRDKASEFDEANKTLKIIKKVQDINKKGRGSISKSVKEDKYSELEYCADDNESTKEKELQEKIFRTYMNAERKKMERFINNEKEGKPMKKSS